MILYLTFVHKIIPRSQFLDIWMSLSEIGVCHAAWLMSREYANKD